MENSLGLLDLLMLCCYFCLSSDIVEWLLQPLFFISCEHRGYLQGCLLPWASVPTGFDAALGRYNELELQAVISFEK